MSPYPASSCPSPGIVSSSSSPPPAAAAAPPPPAAGAAGPRPPARPWTGTWAGRGERQCHTGPGCHPHTAGGSLSLHCSFPGPQGLPSPSWVPPFHPWIPQTSPLPPRGLFAPCLPALLSLLGSLCATQWSPQPSLFPPKVLLGIHQASPSPSCVSTTFHVPSLAHLLCTLPSPPALPASSHDPSRCPLALPASFWGPSASPSFSALPVPSWGPPCSVPTNIHPSSREKLLFLLPPWLLPPLLPSSLPAAPPRTAAAPGSEARYQQHSQRPECPGTTPQAPGSPWGHSQPSPIHPFLTFSFFRAFSSSSSAFRASRSFRDLESFPLPGDKLPRKTAGNKTPDTALGIPNLQGV